MADNPQPNAPLPDPDGAGGEVVSEDDLDALLVEASQLASEISGEVGEVQADATPLSDENQLESESAENEPSDLSPSLSGEDIDSQLENLDRLVDESQSEIGTPTEPDVAEVPSDMPSGDASTSEVDRNDLPLADDLDAKNAISTDTGDSTAASEDDLPDFMQEFTQPSNDSPQKSENQKTPDGAGPVPETSSAKSAHQPTTPKASAESGESIRSAGQPATDRAGRQKGLRLDISRLGHALSPMAIRVTEKAVSVLEVVNSPTQRIGIGIRTAVGWLAIATIGTSVLVFLTSLF